MAQKIEKNESDKAGQESPLRETDTHFHVGAFKIAKKGLDKKTHSAIRDHLFKGGKVKGYQEGGPVASTFDPSTGPIPAPEPPIGTAAGVQSAVAPFAQVPEAIQVGLGGQPPAAPATEAPAVPSLIAAVPGGTPADVGTAPAGAVPPAAPTTGQVPLPTLEEKINELLVRQSGAATGQYQAATRDIGVALKEKAAQTQIYSGLMQGVQERAAYQGEEAQKQIMAEKVRYDKLGDNMMAYILANPIRADRYWADKTTGQKIMGGIGLVLGGIGAGMTGQPNLAFQTIQNAIARDIDAQKANLDTKKSFLSYFMAKTQNNMQAIALANQAMYTAAAAKVRGYEYALAGRTAGPDAAALYGQLRQQAAQFGLQAAQVGMQLAMNKIALMRSYTEMEVTNRMIRGGKIDAQGALALSPALRESTVLVNERQPLVKLDPATGRPLMDPKTGQPMWATNPETGAQLYGTPAQTLRALTNPKNQQQVQGDLATLEQVKNMLVQYKEIVDRNKGTGAIHPNDRAEATRIKIQLEGLIGRMQFATGVDPQKMYKNITEMTKGMVPDPGHVSAQFWNKPMTAWKDFDRTVNENIATIYDNYIIGGRAMMPGYGDYGR